MGLTLPALTASYAGFVNGDSSASLTTRPSVTTAATSASHVGGYAITADGAVDANYTMTYAAGVLTVTSAPLTISANSHTKIYGAASPALTAGYAGFVNGDSSASLTTMPMLSATATTASPVGSYAITAGGAVDANYAISYAPGTLTVIPAPLTVTATNQTKVYGGSDPGLSYAVTGTLYNGDGPSVVSGVSLATASGAAATAGSHPITAAGGTAANYAITDVNGTLTVTPAPLTVTADNQTKIYGAADPSFTASYSGWQYGQMLARSGVSGAPGLSGSDNATARRAITPSRPHRARFPGRTTVQFANGTLTILPAPIFTLTGPSAGTFTAGQSVTIGWTAANVDVAGPSKISLGYDPDSTAFDANQHWIEVDQVTAANGAGIVQLEHHRRRLGHLLSQRLHV